MTIQVLRGETQAERTINEMLRGRANNVGEVTLDASVTTTTISDIRIKQTMTAVLIPRTANAAAAMTNVYISAVADGSITLTHSSTATVDRTFDYILHGS
jgi:uncharacterized protein (UPF0264 family)